MPLLKRRSKMISFRVSEQEYENLIEFCTTHGARSMSDLARDTMCRLLPMAGHNGNGNGNGNGDKPIASEPEIEELYGRLGRVENAVARLTRLLERT
jgi:hypothetical protein